MAGSFSESGSSQHCPNPPKIKLQIPDSTFSVQTVCYAGRGYCQTDTFYRKNLEADLRSRFSESRYVALARIDSVAVKIQTDTMRYNDTNFTYAEYQHEKVWVKILKVIKGNLPESTYFYKDSWIYLPMATEMSYKVLESEPLILFFNEYKTIKDLNVEPGEGCFPDPTAYRIADKGIEKIGRDSERIPGVYLPLPKFLKSIKKGNMKIPSLKRVIKKDGENPTDSKEDKKK